MKWEEYFTINTIENPKGHWDSKDWTPDEPMYHYQVVDPDGKIIGTYKDKKFARKQAQYKFRKLQARLEKILLRS